MNKIWYIFSDNHHRGPFSIEEVIELYKKGIISNSVLIWREGEEDWALLSENEEIYSLVQLFDKSIIKDPPEPPQKKEPEPEPEPEPEEEKIEFSEDSEEKQIPAFWDNDQNKWIQIADADLKNFNQKQHVFNTPKRWDEDKKDWVSFRTTENKYEVWERKEDTELVEEEQVSEQETESSENQVIPSVDEVVEQEIQEEIVAQKKSKVSELSNKMPAIPDKKIVREDSRKKRRELKEKRKKERVEKALLAKQEKKEKKEKKASKQIKSSKKNLDNRFDEVEELFDDSEDEKISPSEEKNSGIFDKIDEYDEKFKGNALYLKIVKWGLSISCVIVLVITLFIFIPFDKKEDIDLSTLSNSSVTRLNNLLKASDQRALKVAMALSTSGNEIWASVNKKGEAVVYLTLTSEKKKILSKKKVVITSKAILKDNFVKFDDLRLLFGKKLVPGYYVAQINGQTTGMKDRFIRFIKSTPLSFLWRDGGHLSEKFSFTGTFLLSIDLPSNFEKKLSKFNTKRVAKKIGPLRSKIENYKLIKMVLTQVMGLYEKHISTITRGAFIKKFESEYVRGVGPMLQNIILNNYKLYKKYSKKSPGKSREYKKIFQLSKRVGKLVSDMAVQTKKYGKITNEKRLILLQDYRRRSDIIKSSIKKKITGLEDKLMGM